MYIYDILHDKYLCTNRSWYFDGNFHLSFWNLALFLFWTRTYLCQYNINKAQQESNISNFYLSTKCLFWLFIKGVLSIHCGTLPSITLSSLNFSLIRFKLWKMFRVIKNCYEICYHLQAKFKNHHVVKTLGILSENGLIHLLQMCSYKWIPFQE